jgi:uncharacterized protein YndB with AHSA1/START domain
MAAMASSGTATITLPTDRQILITREFDAPKDLVYRAWTTPELIRRWWSGDRGTTTSAEVDLRVGGTWRYVHHDHDGFEVAFHGEFREIVSAERIVFTEVYEGASQPLEGDTYPPGEEEGTINTATFEEVDGRTTLFLLVECPSKDVRDAIIGSGMETGMQEGWTKLEEVARSLR